MTLVLIVTLTAALAIVATIGLLWRDARKVDGRRLNPLLIKALRQMDTSPEARRYLEQWFSLPPHVVVSGADWEAIQRLSSRTQTDGKGRYVEPVRWHRSGEVVE